MDTAELVARHPLLFHVAAAGSWPAIRAHGLMTTEQIVLSGGYDEQTAGRMLRQRRPDSVRLDHPVLGAVVLRDQGPLRIPILEQRLVGASVEQWIGMLNDRVFLWLHPEKLLGLLGARRYRDLEHDVLVVDTAGLVRDHSDRIRLSAINSGATLWPSAPERGPQTFRPIADYPYADRRRGRSDATAVAELVVVGGAPDIHRHVVRVERWHGAERHSVLPL